MLSEKNQTQNNKYTIVLLIEVDVRSQEND